ncbi:unnamed protein product [Rangifer tarandus platyrhynchus]|uniref:Uncharacterized protein n=1 Tax=Rangifer tarandus platyrhynchus TaxID=3082113 RepID=A0AC59YAI8_RANTA
MVQVPGSPANPQNGARRLAPPFAECLNEMPSSLAALAELCLEQAPPAAHGLPAQSQAWVSTSAGAARSVSEPQFPPLESGDDRPPTPPPPQAAGRVTWLGLLPPPPEGVHVECLPGGGEDSPGQSTAGRASGGRAPGVGQGWLLPGRLPGRTLGEGGPIPPDS